MRKIETFEWWPELIKVKDEYSLRELADKFKVTPGAITAAFKRTGTHRRSAPPGPRSRRRPRGEDTLPPEPGELRGRPGSKDDRLLQHREMLGSVPDGEVARKAGVSVRTVASFRARHGIPGYDGPRRRGADRSPRKSKIDNYADMVGSVPDHIVAEKAGVSVNAVRNWRIKRGVTAHGRHGKPGVLEAATSTPSMAPTVSPASPGRGGGAWKVISGSGADRAVRVVVARSLADAAARAEAAGVGPVLALEWIAEVL